MWIYSRHQMQSIDFSEITIWRQDSIWKTFSDCTLHFSFSFFGSCPLQRTFVAIRECSEWKLPALPLDIASYGNSVCFSNRYGLVSVGGTQPNQFVAAGSYHGAWCLQWNGLKSINSLKSWHAERSRSELTEFNQLIGSKSANHSENDWLMDPYYVACIIGIIAYQFS